jgi:hypothetical protein
MSSRLFFTAVPEEVMATPSCSFHPSSFFLSLAFSLLPSVNSLRSHVDGGGIFPSEYLVVSVSVLAELWNQYLHSLIWGLLKASFPE